MTRILSAAARWSASALGNLILSVVAGAVALSAIALVSLYMVNYVDETPGMKTLRCLIFPAQADCAVRSDAMDRLQTELAAMSAERARLERQIAGLRAIQDAVDSITLFNHITEPNSGVRIVVGTVFQEFVATNPEPQSYFCYLDLAEGSAGEDRSLYFHGAMGSKEVSPTVLKQTGLSSAALAFARSVCKPQLIGAGP